MTIGEMAKTSAKAPRKKLAGNNPDVMYMGPEAAPFKCEHCRAYIQDNAPCEKVSTPVQAKGCCNLYLPKGK